MNMPEIVGYVIMILYFLSVLGLARQVSAMNSRLEKLHGQLNSRLTELVEATRLAAHSAGMDQERLEARERQGQSKPV